MSRSSSRNLLDWLILAPLCVLGCFVVIALGVVAMVKVIAVTLWDIRKPVRE